MAVRVQQTLEHAVLFYNKHKDCETLPGVYHTLMIAQDHLEAFITVSTYTDKYVEYIRTPEPQPVLPHDTDNMPILEIQEYGPFDLEDREDATTFAIAILAIIMSELHGLDQGRLIKRTLEGFKRMSKDSDDSENKEAARERSKFEDAFRNLEVK